MENIDTQTKLAEAREKLRAPLEEAVARLRALNERARSYIKAHPVACLAGAAALGFVAARVARWRS